VSDDEESHRLRPVAPDLFVDEDDPDVRAVSTTTRHRGPHAGHAVRL